MWAQGSLPSFPFPAGLSLPVSVPAECPGTSDSSSCRAGPPGTAPARPQPRPHPEGADQAMAPVLALLAEGRVLPARLLVKQGLSQEGVGSDSLPCN